MKNTEKAIDFTTHVLLLFWISAKFPSIWYTTWSILSEKIFLLIWEEPFSEIGKIKRLPTTSERVAKLRWIDWSKVSRNQHTKLVLTIWLRNLDSFSLTNRIVWIKFIRDIFPEWNWSFLKKPLLFICAVTEDWWLPLGVEFY